MHSPSVCSVTLTSQDRKTVSSYHSLSCSITSVHQNVFLFLLKEHLTPIYQHSIEIRVLEYAVFWTTDPKKRSSILLDFYEVTTHCLSFSTDLKKLNVGEWVPQVRNWLEILK